MKAYLAYAGQMKVPVIMQINVPDAIPVNPHTFPMNKGRKIKRGAITTDATACHFTRPRLFNKMDWVFSHPLRIAISAINPASVKSARVRPDQIRKIIGWSKPR